MLGHTDEMMNPQYLTKSVVIQFQSLAKLYPDDIFEVYTNKVMDYFIGKSLRQLVKIGERDNCCFSQLCNGLGKKSFYSQNLNMKSRGWRAHTLMIF